MAYDGGTAKRFVFSTVSYRLENEIETADGWKEGLEGACRTKNSIHEHGYGDRRVD